MAAALKVLHQQCRYLIDTFINGSQFIINYFACMLTRPTCTGHILEQKNYFEFLHIPVRPVKLIRMKTKYLQYFVWPQL